MSHTMATIIITLIFFNAATLMVNDFSLLFRRLQHQEHQQFFLSWTAASSPTNDHLQPNKFFNELQKFQRIQKKSFSSTNMKANSQNSSDNVFRMPPVHLELMSFGLQHQQFFLRCATAPPPTNDQLLSTHSSTYSFGNRKADDLNHQLPLWPSNAKSTKEKIEIEQRDHKNSFSSILSEEQNHSCSLINNCAPSTPPPKSSVDPRDHLDETNDVKLVQNFLGDSWKFNDKMQL